ncbi:MAG: DMT family transporter [Aromatoleum sp.]|nr:DMT family transporter [Aromatoleum sp.]
MTAARADSRPPPRIPLRAIALILGSVLCFTLLDTTVKFLTQLYPVPLLVWARWGVQMLVLLLWLGPTMGRGLLKTARPKLQLLRGGILLCSSVSFVTALKYLPLAEATAINYSTPIMVALMAAWILDEKLTRARIGFVLAGFAGMLLIVRPGSMILTGAALLALAAAGFYATFQILTRKLAGEDPRVTLFYPALIGTVAMTAVVPWMEMPAQMPWPHLVLILVGGLLGTLGHFLFILAFRRAPASGLAPFTYMQIVWATLIGWLVFGQFPDPFTLAGMGVIAGSGLLIALHERRRAQPPTQDPTAID